VVNTAPGATRPHRPQTSKHFNGVPMVSPRFNVPPICYNGTMNSYPPTTTCTSCDLRKAHQTDSMYSAYLRRERFCDDCWHYLSRRLGSEG